MWIIFLSTSNPQASLVTTSLCISGSSPEEPSRDSYLSILMSIVNESSAWRSVTQPWSLCVEEDLPVAAPLLSTGPISWISRRPDLKIVWHRTCSPFFWKMITLPMGKICYTCLWCERGISASAHLSFVQDWNNPPVLKSLLTIFQIQQCVLLLLAEPIQDSQCVWSFEPSMVEKDYRLWCYPPCSLHSLRYGNAEDQSCLGIVYPDDLSELIEVDKLLSNYEHIILLGIATGLWPEIKVLINQPLIAITTTSFSTATIHILQIQKLVSVYPLNLTTLEKFIQPSSRQGRERSLSTSSEERTLPPKFIFERNPFLGFTFG